MAWTTPGTATAGEVLTAAFWNTQVRDNMVELAPFFAAWTDYSSSVTFTNFTKGSATVVAAYVKVGRMVIYRGRVTLSGSTMSSDPQVSLPFTPASAALDRTFGSAFYRDAGTRNFVGASQLNSLSRVGFVHTESGNTGALGPNDPFVWTNGDEFAWTITYEASS